MMAGRYIRYREAVSMGGLAPRTPPARREPRIWSIPPFIGRAREIEAFEQQLDEALAGRARIVLIEGEAGIGKTRFLSEVRRTARNRGFLDIHGRAQEGLEAPYLPFLASLFPAVEAFYRESGAVETGLITRFMREAGQSAGSPGAVATAAEPANDQARLYLALSGGVIELARDQSPVLLALDDAQWADTGTLDLLEFLAFSVAEADSRGRLPLVLAVVFRGPSRNSRLARTLGRLRREIICYPLELQGLDELEVGSLVQALGVPRPSHELADSIGLTAQGNPLVIQAVVRQLMKKGAIRRRAGTSVSSLAPSTLDLPRDTTSAIVAQISGLGPDASRILGVAAFLSDGFSLEMLAAACEEPPESVLGALEEGMREGIVANLGDRFHFEHPLLKHVLQDRVSLPGRQAAHVQISRALERLWAKPGAEQVQEIAHHLVAAGAEADPTKVVEFCRAAGSKAMDVFAWSRAGQMFEAALASLPRSGHYEDKDRADLLFLTAFAHHRNEDWDLSVERYHEAMDAFHARGDVRGEALALRGLLNVRVVAGTPMTSVETTPLRDLLGRLGEEDAPVRGHVWAHIGNIAYSSGRLEEAIDAAERALAVGNEIGDADICTKACVTIASVQFQQMRLDEALASYEMAGRYAAACENPWVRGFPLVRMPQVLIALGRLDEAEEVEARALKMSQDVRNWVDCSLAIGYLITIAVLKGEFERVERLASEAMLMINRSGSQWAVRVVLPSLAAARYLRGAWQEAEDVLDRGPVAGASTLRTLFRARADPANAATTAVRPRAASSGRDIFAVGGSAAVVELADVTGDSGLASAQLASLAEAVNRGIVFSSGWPTVVRRVAAIAAAASGEWQQAEEHFAAAIRAADAAGARPELGRCYLDFGRALIAHSDGQKDRRALDLVRDAHDLLSTLGMAAFAQQAAALLSGMTRPARPGPSAETSFTLSEMAVFQQIARGFTRSQIGDALLLGEDTVARLASSIAAKTGVESREGALAYAKAHNLLLEGPAPLPQPELLAEGAEGQTRVILMTDIVDSVALTEEMGDVPFRQIARELDADLRLAIREHAGQAVEGILFGDGIMALFTSAQQAIRCAFRCRDAAQARGIQLHLGLNAGDILWQDGNAYGSAVNMTKRVCDTCAPGQVMVSDTVRNLARTSQAFAFEARGEHALKGIREAQRLFAVELRGEAGRLGSSHGG